MVILDSFANIFKINSEDNGPLLLSFSITFITSTDFITTIKMKISIKEFSRNYEGNLNFPVDSFRFTTKNADRNF